LVDVFQISLVYQCVPLDTGDRSIPYLHRTKSIRCGPGGPRLSAGRAITSEDQCTSNQALPYHEIKGHPSVQHAPGLQPF